MEDALKVKKKHDKLIRKYSERQQVCVCVVCFVIFLNGEKYFCKVADEKVIRKMLKKQIPGKVLADFEENAFDDEFAENNSGCTTNRNIFATKKKTSEISEKPETNELKVHISPEDIAEGHETADENGITLDSDDEDEEDQIVVDNSMDEEHLKQYGFIKSILLWNVTHVSQPISISLNNIPGQLLKRQEFLTYFIAFLKLFFIGVIESTIIWLLKLSRKYRYVAHVLGHEKASYKQGISPTDHVWMLGFFHFLFYNA